MYTNGLTCEVGMGRKNTNKPSHVQQERKLNHRSESRITNRFETIVAIVFKLLMTVRAFVETHVKKNKTLLGRFGELSTTNTPHIPLFQRYPNVPLEPI